VAETLVAMKHSEIAPTINVESPILIAIWITPYDKPWVAYSPRRAAIEARGLQLHRLWVEEFAMVLRKSRCCRILRLFFLIIGLIPMADGPRRGNTR